MVVAGAGVVTTSSRQDLTDEQRQRYFANISSHRPFELELLRWNHDRGDPEDPEDPQQAAFQQLHCLVGRYRQLRDSRPGGGITWKPLELAGVFLRHRHGRALVWLPEAGGNFLVQAAPQAMWMLVEVGHMEMQRIILDKTRSRGGVEVSAAAEAAFNTHLNEQARVWEADDHLTDEWLQAAEDLRELWSWDWSALRKDSAFQLAFPKFVYTPGYPIADVKHGYHGEERFRWSWTEDPCSGNLFIKNQSWSSDAAKACLSEEGVRYIGLLGDQVSFGPLCSWRESEKSAQ